MFFWALLLKHELPMAENKAISIGDEGMGFGLRAAEFEMTAANGIFRPSNLASRTTLGRRGRGLR